MYPAIFYRHMLDAKHLSSLTAELNCCQLLFISFSSPVPSQPPQDVRIMVLTSQSMRVTWSKPPSNAINGQLLGYKVYYFIIKRPEKIFNRTVRGSDARNVTLTELGKFTRYKIRVAAFTRKGVGVESVAKVALTKEDSKYFDFKDSLFMN